MRKLRVGDIKYLVLSEKVKVELGSNPGSLTPEA